MKPLIKKVSDIFKKVGMLFFILGAYSVSAYEALESLPNLTGEETTSLGGYLSNIYALGIGLAGVLAVLMIVIGGLQYIGSGMSPSGKNDARDRITNAVLGLLLALLSWLILNTIDPNLVSLNF